MKRHLQCAEQQAASVTLQLHQILRLARGATALTLQRHQILRLPRKVFFCAAADLARGLVGQKISYLLVERKCNNCKKPRYHGSPKQEKSPNNQHKQQTAVLRQLGVKVKPTRLKVPTLSPSPQ